MFVGNFLQPGNKVIVQLLILAVSAEVTIFDQTTDERDRRVDSHCTSGERLTDQTRLEFVLIREKRGTDL